ncbi:hypothetical protein LTS10_011216 [Elasticomyces elasticus]|nr:hypothetical protein LTS10_011216 [Elasticomyces elasticus]
MTLPTLTPEALAHAEDVAQRYNNGAIILGLLAWIPLMYIFIQIYARTLIRIFLFLVPSAYPIGLFTAAVISQILMETGISINWLGIRIRVAALPPQATDTPIGRLCHLSDKDTVMGFLLFVMVLMIPFGLLGLIAMNAGVDWLWCDSCKQERKRGHWKKADYGKGGDKPDSARCRQCQDLECGGFVVEEKKMLEKSLLDA